jgi:hypothetical protein
VLLMALSCQQTHCTIQAQHPTLHPPLLYQWCGVMLQVQGQGQGRVVHPVSWQ